MVHFQEERSSSRMLVGMAVILFVHVGLFIALKNGLASKVVPILPKHLQAVFVELSAPKPSEPAPALPKIEQPKMEELQMPMPDIQVPVEAPLQTAVPQSNTAPAEESGNGESTAVTQLQVDSRYPLTKPEYPAISRRLNEAGTVTLLLYVLPNGRVGEAKIGKSSGYPRLDESALREAKRNWRFIPGTYGGQSVAGWGTFAITFKLEN